MPKTPEERRAYSLAYYAAHKEQCKGYHKKWVANNPRWEDSHPHYKRDWTRKQMLNSNYKAKRREYAKVRDNLHPEKRSKIRLTKERVRAKNQSKNIPVEKCEFCGATKRIVRHHPDYAYPKIIIACCDSCHRYIHLDLKAIAVEVS
jgi:hypothetical protein